MRKHFVLAAVMLATLLPTAAFAEQVKITVKGMVCSFCAQGIKKTFSGKAGVESVDVNLDTKVVTVVTKKGVALPDAEISQTIVDAGFEVITIERTPDA